MTEHPAAEHPSPVTPQTECTETDWPRGADGYGFKVVEGIKWRAHRYAWTQANGPIPAGLLVCHQCDNPPCVNVGHLFLGTIADNNRDRDRKGRAAPVDREHMARIGGTPMFGERNPRAKLTAEDVRFIRASQETAGPLARRFGVNRRTIAKIRRGVLWANL